MRIGPFAGLTGGPAVGSGIAARLHLDFTRGLAVRDNAAVPLDHVVAVSRATGGHLPDGRAFGADTARRGRRGLLIEEGRSNLVANAFAPGDQTVSLPAGTFALSVGSGSGSGSGGEGAVLSGAASGSAAPDAPLVFTLAAPGDVDLTMTGTPLWVQIEAGSFATSPIATTSGGTRAGDVVSLSDTAWLDPAASRIEVEWEQIHDGSLAENGVATLLRWMGPAGYSRLRAGSVSFAQIRAADGTLAVNAGAGQTTPTGIHQLVWEGAGAEHTVAWSEGLAGTADNATSTTQVAATAVDAVHLGSNGSAEFLNGWLRRITVT